MLFRINPTKQGTLEVGIVLVLAKFTYFDKELLDQCEIIFSKKAGMLHLLL